jgi:hypothetical protein
MVLTLKEFKLSQLDSWTGEFTCLRTSLGSKLLARKYKIKVEKDKVLLATWG